MPTLISEPPFNVVPAAIGKVLPPIVMDPGVEAVAAVYAATTPQTLTVDVALAVTVVGATICPPAFNVPFRQMFAPTVMRPEPSMVVAAAIVRVCPPMVMDPGAVAVAAV